MNQAAMWIINEETLTRARYVRPTSHGFLHSSGSAYFARDLAFQRMDFLDGRPTATVTVVEDGNGGRVAQLRGFGAHEPLDVWLRPKPVELGVVTTDADGSVDVPFSGPLPRGDYEVTASRPMTRGQIGGGTFTIDDSVAPTTKAAVVGARGRPADVSVTLTTTDAGDSGLARTEYRVDAGAWTTYSQPITFATGGSFTVAYRSIDGAGNVEATQSVVVPVRWDKGCGDHGENEKGNGGRPGCGNVPGQPNAGKP
ncbi:hypothetical protein ET989_12850 [Propioniciclava sinopodophylli]|uniref:Bacterial Ig-like domain-containing protein n=1 Tax=Propioniciclava sinopodophylli TaxID=1837344 RepID=A0A4Q9KDA1_9ACTN|nr:hypothetical protein [Propioniciclava sinopodophylli]TBT83019.1 hypothetical protein ET989_12850 [Propioniciclava sinopodophylli]